MDILIKIRNFSTCLLLELVLFDLLPLSILCTLKSVWVDLFVLRFKIRLPIVFISKVFKIESLLFDIFEELEFAEILLLSCKI